MASRRLPNHPVSRSGLSLWAPLHTMRSSNPPSDVGLCSRSGSPSQNGQGPASTVSISPSLVFHRRRAASSSISILVDVPQTLHLTLAGV